jgi:hypothetical protein
MTATGESAFGKQPFNGLGDAIVLAPYTKDTFVIPYTPSPTLLFGRQAYCFQIIATRCLWRLLVNPKHAEIHFLAGGMAGKPGLRTRYIGSALVRALPE